MENEVFFKELNIKIQNQISANMRELAQKIKMESVIPPVKPTMCHIVNRNMNYTEKPHPLAKKVNGHWMIELAFDYAPFFKLSIFKDLEVLVAVVIIDTDNSISLRFTDIKNTYKEVSSRMDKKVNIV